MQFRWPAVHKRRAGHRVRAHCTDFPLHWHNRTQRDPKFRSLILSPPAAPPPKKAELKGARPAGLGKACSGDPDRNPSGQVGPGGDVRPAPGPKHDARGMGKMGWIAGLQRVWHEVDNRRVVARKTARAFQ